MKIYENVVIGNFLYGLGVAVGTRLDSDTLLPSVVNLIQQTPVDKELADVLLNFPGVVRLIEFKMKGARLTKERLRHRLLRAALDGENEVLVDTCRRVHWYVEVGVSHAGALLISRVVPYLDAFEPELMELKAGGIEQLVMQTAHEAIRKLEPLARERAEIYLRFLRSLQENDPVDAGGVLLVMSGGGVMHYAELRDICDLSMPHRVWLERELRGPEIAPRTPSLERREKQKVRKHKGPEIGM
ncbi:hypothetical protein [Pseudomonas aeruginosa]|uniref:hypothetical protein n=1 Tax=Pseudomonas aeruginosa TaxID=287 RepID=UPI000940EAF6|nr:hypothetical protein [Pseudomonas aeruginosa]MCO3843625.1 hypothetical protein [Pseudomonas aeruginosa]NPW39421.1 hypothetical protein [Pseudomonas aeruginosa]HBP1183183.1 hypothetical protein [Pseudomonas aeruginosa]HCL4171929.1 hypothetical protein [Pseudomonas aeruginosa]HEP8173708.1 hypothetical protein [Pseudomonas aeruginosa]